MQLDKGVLSIDPINQKERKKNRQRQRQRDIERENKKKEKERDMDCPGIESGRPARSRGTQQSDLVTHSSE